MSIAKTGALPDSYKYVTVSVDSFDGRLLQGRLYHDSQEEGMSFGCISEMAHLLENLYDGLHYPMKSVEQRSFVKRDHAAAQDFEGGDGSRQKREPGKLAEYQLHVKYRFNATWQGEIKDIRDGGTFSFSSFLELMEYLDQSLGQDSGKEQHGLGKRMCEVAVRNVENYVMAGDVSHPAVEMRRNFSSIFDLKDAIEYMLLPRPEGETEGKIITPRSVLVNAGCFGPMTFVVRVLFRRNATWQGTICWKEKRRQVSFRSFLEMLMVMQEAVSESEGWAGEQETASGQVG